MGSDTVCEVWVTSMLEGQVIAGCTYIVNPLLYSSSVSHPHNYDHYLGLYSNYAHYAQPAISSPCSI